MLGASLWFTYSVNEGHDPVAQVIIGEDVDLDHFEPVTCSLSSQDRAHNVARDPYGVAKYFQVVTLALFEQLLGIQVGRSSVRSRMGLFGMVDAYMMFKEVQGRGGLHGHSLLWLSGTPAASRLRIKFQDVEFRNRICRFLEQVICAHLDGMTEHSIANHRRSTKPNPSWARPPHPADEDYESVVDNHLLRIVMSSQVHTCQRGSCLIRDRYGQERCKRRAPFPLSDNYVVNEDGTYALQRSLPMVNSFNPAISSSLMCNNDVKLITNGSATNDLLFYLTNYAAKKQGRSYNQSALLAKQKLFPELVETNEDDTQAVENGRKLLIRCMNTLIREQEVAGPLVVTLLMGWKDTLQSHRFVAIYWKDVERAVRIADPNLQRELDDET
jgi:hypothetical protein